MTTEREREKEEEVEEGERARRRPSPRWREPLVDEFLENKNNDRAATSIPMPDPGGGRRHPTQPYFDSGGGKTSFPSSTTSLPPLRINGTSKGEEEETKRSRTNGIEQNGSRATWRRREKEEEQEEQEVEEEEERREERRRRWERRTKSWWTDGRNNGREEEEGFFPKTAEEEGEEERQRRLRLRRHSPPFFFSEDFYRAFPHLRPRQSSAAAMAAAASSSSPVPPPPPTPHPAKGARNATSRLSEFSSYLDRFDRNWRSDPFWRDLYPRWAEPVFKEGIDVKTNITNDSQRFAVEIDCYQFRPEELQVKTLDDTLLIEGRHEDVRDRDNYTKMYFVRKYQLPTDVDPQTIGSHVDSQGRLTVEAAKRWQAIDSRERAIPIESQSAAARRFGDSRSASYSPRDRFYDSGRGIASDYFRAESRQEGGRGVGGGSSVGGGGTGSSSYLLSPKSNNGGYRSEFEQRQTDANVGMRHEARREEFREEVRRTGSAANVLSPPMSTYRPSSRLSAADSAGGHHSESHFRRTSSATRNEYRNGYGGEHLLRPAEELKSSSVFGRSVPIQRA